MKVTFIFHSSFAVELEQTILIFDYYGEGCLPEIPDGKQIYFLNSHSHKDHYKKEILLYRNQFPHAEYIFSDDIRIKEEERKTWIHSVKRDREYSIGPMKIRTLNSTDQGVAFIIETEGICIYHAGDLNWWHWNEEDKAWNNNMAANYKREIDKIRGRHFNLSFVVLDPRQEEAYSRGMDYFLEHTENDHVFPMHCWERYEICRKYQKEKQGKTDNMKYFHCLEYPGQVWKNIKPLFTNPHSL